MAIPDINIKAYDYELPDNRIAKYPLAERDTSKLLVYRDGQIAQSRFRAVNDFLPQGSPIVFNDTRVIRARLRFHKETGAEIEIFCLEPLVPAEVQQAFETTAATTWKCIVGNSKKWKTGTLTREVVTPRGRLTLAIERVGQTGNTSSIRFEWDNAAVSFAEIIETAGVVPIPPYLNRETEEVDTTRYQTVYSHYKGSVAAPTAGLHFTDALLDELGRAGHERLYLTLHVGAGTFKPVQTDTIGSHVMHTEHIVVESALLGRLIECDRPLTAVGTTSVRTLESLYWLGVRLLCSLPIDCGVMQWDAYELPQHYGRAEALQALRNYVDAECGGTLHSMTQIMIVPGYDFRIVDVLITNFHQPHSTLLLLIGAFVGADWRRIYDYALGNDFRFLSYGDSSVLYRRR